MKINFLKNINMAAALLKTAASFGANAVRDAAIKEIPKLIQDNGPAIEKSLSVNLTTMKAQAPQEAQLFLANWRKLNAVVEKTLSAGPAVPARRGGKRTRRHKRNARK
jgi:hypothetical protein